VSWPYAIVFALLAVLCCVIGLAGAGATSGLSLVLHYPAISFVLVAVAYAGGGSRLFGKRPDGRRSFLALALLGPYLLLNRISFFVYKLSTRHQRMHEIAPELWLGRRLGGREARSARVAAVLDLAAEFTDPREFRTGSRYLSLPLLDATAPTPEQLRQAVAWVAERSVEGPVFVHCALGHGRSACVVIACLLHSGRITTIRDGLRLVRQHRPRVGLTPAQRAALRCWEGRIPSTAT
jgi:protein-tyrosine phosphatase